MLVTISETVKEAYVELLGKLIAHSSKHDDPELYREDVAVAHIRGESETGPAITLENGAIKDTFPYSEYFPHVTPELVDLELRYRNRQFIEERRLAEIVSYLRANPLSKRAITLLWQDEYRDLSKGASCEIAAFFRLKDGRLEMHTHMRANNASFLLFMDMRILTGIQRLVAKSLGVPAGDYVHFIDSLHIYETERAAVLKQAEIVATSEAWQKL
jgi:hypothetical protein